MRLPAALARATLPAPLLEVLRRLGAAGHRSWVVGGAVRDLLLGRHREVNDFDVATPATPQQVQALFRKVIPTGAEHGTVTVVEGGVAIEVTTFRGEGAYVDGRRPESVTFHTDLEADLGRRDFTINALAWDPLAREFRDPWRGRADLAAGVIRAVGVAAERFAEDGLRPMRAVRFAAQLGYDLAPETRRAIPGALEVVRKVAVERISDELSRLVVARDAPRGVRLLRDTGLLGVAVPELAVLPGARLAHAARVLAMAPADEALRFAALLHVVPADHAEKILVRLRQPRRISDEVGALLRAHVCRDGGPAGGLPAEPPDVRRFLSRAGPGRATALVALARAEASAAPARAVPRARAEVDRLARSIAEVKASGAPLLAQDLALDGRAAMDILGVGPGPHVGEALRHLLARVLEEPALNGRDSLAQELRRWWAGRGRGDERPL